MNYNNNNPRNGNNTTQACAACKYQRRKCAPDCILAPYFPHDRQRQFLNAHKLFGVSNITKIIKFLEPHEKDQAMRTIIYQSDMRANDPVGGCFRHIQDLQAQIEYYHAELELVLQQLAFVRAQAHQQQQSQHVYNPTMSNVNVGINGEDVMSASDPLSLYNAPLTNQYHYISQVPQHEHYIMLPETNENNCSNNNNNAALQEHVNAWTMQNSMSLSSLSLQGQNSNASVGDEYDPKPMLEIPCDERNELGFEVENLVHHSDDAVLFKIDDEVIKEDGDYIQQAQDHDLKGAATLFTLTNCTS
ncbi:PREDICTED: LOB domain-containing protein 22-like [Lupinus angustifolius]|uniref:LOB domain-containing protein 22-like n=1 Tax=Lupinus angustifolius TaxID=3871 RepID=UPI00092F278D|nr:PREDICTED: LOB domain-containing protein 22-like [Lupinus angustifolius]